MCGWLVGSSSNPSIKTPNGECGRCMCIGRYLAISCARSCVSWQTHPGGVSIGDNQSCPRFLKCDAQCLLLFAFRGRLISVAFVCSLLCEATSWEAILIQLESEWKFEVTYPTSFVVYSVLSYCLLVRNYSESSRQGWGSCETSTRCYFLILWHPAWYPCSLCWVRCERCYCSCLAVDIHFNGGTCCFEVGQSSGVKFRWHLVVHALSMGRSW